MAFIKIEINLKMFFSILLKHIKTHCIKLKNPKIYIFKLEIYSLFKISAKLSGKFSDKLKSGTLNRFSAAMRHRENYFAHKYR